MLQSRSYDGTLSFLVINQSKPVPVNESRNEIIHLIN